MYIHIYIYIYMYMLCHATSAILDLYAPSPWAVGPMARSYKFNIA